MYRRADPVGGANENTPTRRGGAMQKHTLGEEPERPRAPPPLTLLLASSTDGCDRAYQSGQEGVVLFNATHTGNVYSIKLKPCPEDSSGRGI